MVAKQVSLPFPHHFLPLVLYSSCVSPDSIVRNMDYSITSIDDMLSVTFPAVSSATGSTECVNVTIIDDAALEGNHSFTVSVSSLELIPGGEYSGLEIGMPATVNIMDDDGMIRHNEGTACKPM